MHRIDTPTAQKDKWGAGKDGYTDGDPSTGVKSTALNSAIFDSLQEEICNVIEKNGITLDKAKNDQLFAAIQVMIETSENDLNLGTAAFHDITTSTSDITAGRVLKVGDGGLLGSAIGATDANLTAKEGLVSMLFKQGGGTGTSHFGGFGAGAHLEYGDSGDGTMTLSANIFITNTGEIVTEWMGVNKSTGAVTSTLKHYLSTNGGVVDGRTTFKETGAGVVMQPDSAGQPIYLLGRDSDGATNLFYIGKGSANINDILLNNYKGNNSFKLSENGEVWIQPASGHNAIVNAMLEIRTAAPELIFTETDSGKKYIFVGDGSDFRMDEDSTAGNNVWKWSSATNTLTVNGAVVPSNYSNFDTHYQKINTASKAANGWFKDTNTGMIFQWGHNTSTAVGNATVTFPIAFPNACLNVQNSWIRGANNPGENPWGFVSSFTNTTASITGDANGSYWFAMGY